MKNSMKKNILFVNDERMIGGVSILLEDILRVIDYSKYNVDILILHNNGDRMKNLPEGVNIFYGTKFFDTIDIPIREILSIKYIGKLISKARLVFYLKTGLINNKIKKERKKILNKQYDAEIAFKDGFTAIFTANGDSIKKIHWLHSDYLRDDPNAKYKKLLTKAYDKFDVIVGISEGVKKHFNDIYRNSEKTIVINDLIDEQKVKDMAGEKEPYTGEKLRVTCVGRLHPYKGFEQLLYAMKKLKDEGLLDNININVLGEGFERKSLINLRAELGLDNYIEFLGNKENPYTYLNNSDLFILSSKAEAFGIVVVEAQMLGVPVLATDCVSIRELVTDNVTGLVVENSAEGLYNGFKKLIIDKELLSEFSENLKTYQYNNNKIIKELNDLFA